MNKYIKLKINLDKQVCIFFLTASILLAFVIFVANIVKNDYVIYFDKSIILYVHQNLSNDVLDTIISISTNVGSPEIILLIAAVVSIFFAYKRRYINLVTLVATISGATLLTYIIKNIIERVRPSLWSPYLVNESGFSFVSGHATLSMALVLVLVSVYWFTKRHMLILASGVMYVLYVAFTRIYLGVHYPTDILCGWVVAVAWFLVVKGLIRCTKIKKVLD